MKGKRQKNKYNKLKRCRVKKPLNKSIEDRPSEVMARNIPGHWEMDLVEGKRGGSGKFLMVLTERKTRNEIIRKIPDKTQKSVVRVLDKLAYKLGRKKFRKVFKSITVDNGSEFLDADLLEKSVVGGKRTTMYYCHPYSAFERGSNENQNKMIRRFVPKGVDIDNYSNKQIRDIQDWINKYPRKILDYYSSEDKFMDEFGIAV